MPSTPSSAPPEPARSRRARGILTIVAVTVVAVVAGVTWLAVRDSTGGTSDPKLAQVAHPRSAKLGQPAPDFELTTLDGKTVKLSDYRGKPVVLNFWASWCTPCRKEFPLLRNTLAAHHGDFVLVGVDTNDPIESDGRTFAEQEKAGWPNGFDPDAVVARGYGVNPLPQTFFIDRDGVIRSQVFQQLDPATFRTELAKITRPPTTSTSRG
ncbi:MAG: TlpA family protein disulfide reductase [Acidimicrobiia bacterium]